MKLFIALITLSMYVSVATAQEVKYVQLKQGKVSFSPKGYYVGEVVDDREGRGAIGELRNGNKKEILAFANSVTITLNNYIKANVVQDNRTQRLQLHVTRLKIDISRKGPGWQGSGEVVYTFFTGEDKLIEYTSKGTAQMGSAPEQYAEKFTRESLVNAMKQFELWWGKNKGSVVTNEGVRANVTVAQTTKEKDHIAYSVNRPLRISDFTGPAVGRPEELAATISGISYSSKERIVDGMIVLDIVITPHFNVKDSWFREEGKTPEVLAHEQTHFDITAIKACELAAQIRKASLTRKNHDAVLKRLHDQNYLDMSDEQEAYDGETNHGIIRDKQLAWEKKVTEQVKKSGCY